MADSLTEEEDVVMVYGSTAHSAPQSQPKIRHLQNDDSKETLSSNNKTSAFEEITNDMAHCEFDKEDQEELLNPVGTRDPEMAQPGSLDKWEDEISIAPTGIYTDFSCWKHPKVQKNWKVVLTSILLFVTGIVLICVGVAVQVTHSIGIHSVVFYIAGVICIIPGAYHVIYIYCAVKGKKGYHFSHLPVLK